MRELFESVVPASHPALAGHFPGHPVVPAVVILACVNSALRTWDGCLTGISHAKFTDVLRPDEQFTITLSGGAPERILFDCRKADGTPFANGQLLASHVGGGAL